MNKVEKTITINNTPVTMCYCAGVEVGYEKISGKSSAIFIPKVEYDENGNVSKVLPPDAMLGDWIMLAVSAIVAYYDDLNQDSPVDAKYLLRNATYAEVNLLNKTIIALRNEWYQVPDIIKKDEPTEADKKEGKKRKNA